MKEGLEDILAIGVLVAMVANVSASWRTGNWAFAPTSQGIAKRLFLAWSLIVLVFAYASLCRWIDSLWFILFAVGGQIVWQVWLAGFKLLNKDQPNQQIQTIAGKPGPAQSDLRRSSTE